MDNIWSKIAYAILMAIMLILIWPRANKMLKEGPKGSTEQWLSVLKPLVLIVVFVIILIMLVR